MLIPPAGQSRSQVHVARLATAAMTVVLLAGCKANGRTASADGNAAPGSGAGAARSNAIDPHDWFTDVADASGLHFVHFNGMSGEFYFPEIMPPGVGLLDYDNDGDLDVFLVQGDMIGPGKKLSDALFKPVGPLPLKGRLYRNDLQ